MTGVFQTHATNLVAERIDFCSRLRIERNNFSSQTVEFDRIAGKLGLVPGTDLQIHLRPSLKNEADQTCCVEATEESIIPMRRHWVVVGAVAGNSRDRALVPQKSVYRPSITCSVCGDRPFYVLV